MKPLVSLLRAVNVSGQNKIKMADLKKSLEKAGFAQVRTYIQSGNIICRSKLTTESVSAKINQCIQQDFACDVDVFVFTLEQWQTLIKNNRFAKNKGVDLSKLHVMVLSQTPQASLLEKLAEADIGNDQFVLKDAVMYLYCPNGYGKSKLANSLLEKKLKLRGTTRNWKTVNALLDLAQADD